MHAGLYAASAPDWDTPLQTLTADERAPCFGQVAPGRYAVQLFVDENGNGQLDLTPRGRPLEPVGFSGNPGLLKGKPTPDKAGFAHGEEATRLDIRLRSAKRGGEAQAPAN